jgi:hypothetical protein
MCLVESLSIPYTMARSISSASVLERKKTTRRRHKPWTHTKRSTSSARGASPAEEEEEEDWEIKAIVGERGDAYRVEWKGRNPRTRKPWAPSWVPKEDVHAADCIAKWAAKKKAEKVPARGRRRRR